MAFNLKDLVAQKEISPKIQTQVSSAGLSLQEIAKVIELGKLQQYLDPVISKIGDPQGPVMDRDISGHVHTTG